MDNSSSGSVQTAFDDAIEKLLNAFIACPLIGSPQALNVKQPVHANTAKSYRPKFLLSYSFCLLRHLLPGRSAEVDAAARHYTCYGPALRILFKTLTGVNEFDADSGFVGFARSWRAELQSRFGVDLELYTMQYLPCLFHRACPALVKARNKEQCELVEKRPSLARLRILESAHTEEYVLRSRLAYLKSRPALWTQMSQMGVRQRGRIFRELDLRQGVRSAHVGFGVGV